MMMHSRGRYRALLLGLLALGSTTGAATPRSPMTDPVVEKFEASPPRISPGEKSTLSWKCLYTNVVTIDGIPGVFLAEGSYDVYPVATTEYLLTAAGNSPSSTTARTTVEVLAGPGPFVLAFGADPSWIKTGQSSTLSWKCRNTTSVRISGVGGSFPPAGCVRVLPIQPTSKYTLTATGTNSSTATAEATVHVGKRTLLAGDVYVNDSIVGTMIFVPWTGTNGFKEGSQPGELCRVAPVDEYQFRHVLTRNIAVMKTEVTRKMWADLKSRQKALPNDPSFPLEGSTRGSNHPVQSVPWCEALLLANLLSIEQGRKICYYTDSSMTAPISVRNYRGGAYYCDFSATGYRLPTEGEWEYFCRAGTATPFWVKEPLLDTNCTNCVQGALKGLESVAWFCANSFGTTHVVGSWNLKKHPWNLYDVHGSVSEWCWDLYGAYPTGTVTNYEGGSSGDTRIFRGGGFRQAPGDCRSARRGRATADIYGANDHRGFRLVRTIP
ncbi:MAG: formylglycine-generating enzyme family protein [Acidobacteriota bacterium]